MQRIVIPTAQALAFAGISKEQLRYWKGSLGPIARRDGRKKGYSFVEVVALAAISRAMAQFSLDISRFAEVGEAFFEAVDDVIRHERDPGIVHLSEDRITIGHADGEESEVSLVFRIDLVAERLRVAMTRPVEEPQLALM